MGSPLSPVIANLFMQDIEERAIRTAEYKPKLWLRYVDDTFIIWTHGVDKLTAFLEYINSIHPKIKFTMELEKRCRDEKVIPKSMKLSFHKKNQKTKNILRRASLALIRESIHDTRREIDQINSRLLKLHLILGNTLHPVLWNILDTLSNFRAETNADLTKTKQIKKFERLSLEQHPRETPQQDTCKLVYNFSNFTLDEATKSVLSKGFNFAVAPARIPIENIICEVESSITNIPSDTAETIRQDVSRILRTAKPPKRNLTHEEKEALNSLRKNKEIIVLPADKEHHFQLIPREKSSRCPKLYGLPKVHKDGLPLRPIVSSIGSPLQPLARFLAEKLQPYAEEADSYVKNAGHFIERIKDVTLGPGHLLPIKHTVMFRLIGLCLTAQHLNSVITVTCFYVSSGFDLVLVNI
ncbi:uncharacterized protein [Diabrotica undecimpunctata]|uniref:uncharacterized protein n=1 Tax=Diabrotica undecimpunctata TaxID=50387 RepID=UPI003B634AF2